MFKSQSTFNVLYTSDIEKTYDFFKGLGLEIKQHENDKVVVVFGSFDLHFVLSSTEPFEAYKYITETNNYGQGIIFYIETTDIRNAQRLIEERGGVIKAPVFKNNWGCEELLFEDTNGYKFALFQEL
ncbi:MAG: VOC family protein [Candidatus Roizmanbacteria bacterium]|nr:VOC family protein [Candidatus Roizmanbacteria bacterium]